MTLVIHCIAENTLQLQPYSTRRSAVWNRTRRTTSGNETGLVLSWASALCKHNYVESYLVLPTLGSLLKKMYTAMNVSGSWVIHVDYRPIDHAYLWSCYAPPIKLCHEPHYPLTEGKGGNLTNYFASIMGETHPHKTEVGDSTSVS